MAKRVPVRKEPPIGRPLRAGTSPGVAMFGDMVMAMITVTWVHGLHPVKTPPGYELNVALAALAGDGHPGGGRDSGDPREADDLPGDLHRCVSYRPCPVWNFPSTTRSTPIRDGT